MGPCTANDRLPTVDSRCRGTTISCCMADLSRCLPTTSVTGIGGFTQRQGEALPPQILLTLSRFVFTFQTRKIGSVYSQEIIQIVAT